MHKLYPPISAIWGVTALLIFFAGCSSGTSSTPLPNFDPSTNSSPNIDTGNDASKEFAALKLRPIGTESADDAGQDGKINRGASKKPIAIPGAIYVDHPVSGCPICRPINTDIIGATFLTGLVQGPFTYTGTTAKDPDTAYDTANDRYIVVWQETNTSGEGSIYAKLLQNDGTTVIIDKTLISTARPNQGCLYKNFTQDAAGITAPVNCASATEPSVAYGNGKFLITWTLNIVADHPGGFPFSVIIGNMVDAARLEAVSENWSEGIMLSKVEFASRLPDRPAAADADIMSWGTHKNSAVAYDTGHDVFFVVWETNRDFVDCADTARWASESIYGRVIAATFSPDGGNKDRFAVFTDPSALNRTQCAPAANVITAANAQAAYDPAKGIATVFEFTGASKNFRKSIGGKLVTIDNDLNASVANQNQTPTLFEKLNQSSNNPDIVAAGGGFVMINDVDKKNLASGRLAVDSGELKNSGDPKEFGADDGYISRPRLSSNRKIDAPEYVVAYEKRASLTDANSKVEAFSMDDNFEKVGVTVAISNGGAAQNTGQELASSGTDFLAVWTGKTGSASSIYGRLAEIEAPATNQKPTARITVTSGSATVNEGSAVTLGASGSSDPEDGTNLTYRWEYVSGPNPVNFTGTTSVSASFVAPHVTNAQDMVIRLTVYDTHSTASDPVTQTITVNPVTAQNNKPVAHITFVAGSAQVPETSGAPNFTPTTITLSGITSDDGDANVTQALTYQWAQTNAGTNNTIVNPRPAGAHGEQFTFEVPDVSYANRTAGLNITIRLIVDDGQAQDHASDPVTITINVSFVNRPPAVDLGTDRSVNSGTAVTITASGSDLDTGQPLTYNWQRTDTTGLTINFSGQGTREISFTAPQVSQGTTVTFRATVNDGAASASDSVNVTINPMPNNKPVARTIFISGGARVNENGGPPNYTPTTITLSGATSDDGDAGVEQPLTYQWSQTNAGSGNAIVNPSQSGAHGELFTFTVPDVNYANSSAGLNITIRLVVDDGQTTNHVSDPADLTINIAFVNKPPAIELGTDRNVTEGDTVTITANGSDPDTGQPLTYNWYRTDTTGLTINFSGQGTNQISFTAPQVEQNTTVTFGSTVSDGTASALDSVNISISQVQNNRPVARVIFVTGSTHEPETSGGPDFTPTTVTLSALTSDDGDAGVEQPLTYHWSQINIGGGNAIVSPTQSGPHGEFFTFTLPNVSYANSSAGLNVTIRLVVDDGQTRNHASDPADVTTSVSFVNRPPSIDISPNQSVTEGSPVTITASGSDPDTGQPLTYNWYRTDTTGLTISFNGQGTNQISFTAPLADQPTTVTFEAGISDGLASASKGTNVTISPVQNNKPVARVTFVSGSSQVPETGAAPNFTPTTITLSGATSDDGDPGTEQTIIYQWSQINAGGGNAIVNPAQSGAHGELYTFTVPDVSYANSSTGLNITIRLVADDGQARNHASDPTDTAINVSFINKPPTIGLGADRSVTEGAAVTITASGGDPDTGQPITYTWQRTDTTGLTIDLTGQGTSQISFTAPNVVNDTTVSFETTVNDGMASASDNINLTINNLNHSPSTPELTLPADEETLPPTRAYLAWNTSTDPDTSEGDTVVYDVYVGVNSGQMQIHTGCQGISTTNCIIDPLLASTAYSWRVVARDSLGAETTSATRTIETDNSLTAWWKLDDGPSGLCAGDGTSLAGTRACDSSGNTRHGTLMPSGGGPAWLNDGDTFRSSLVANVLGLALGFDGDDYLRFAGLDFGGKSAGAFEFNLHPDRIITGDEHELFGSERTSDQTYFVYLVISGTNGRILLILHTASGDKWVNTTSPIPLNAWNHLIAQFGPGGMKIYLNGSLAASKPDVVTIGNYTGLSEIGWSGWSGVGYYWGMMDDVIIYNRELTQEEITNSINARNALLGH